MRARERKLDDAVEALQRENARLKRDAKKLVADLEGTEPFMQAAISWWANKRPVDWSLMDHAKQPTVNCVGPVECHLALMVCELVRRRVQ